MKTKDTIKKLEFKKETIAKLGGHELSNFHGGNTGTGPSVAYANQCTFTQRTRGQNYTCNVVNCKDTK